MNLNRKQEERLMTLLKCCPVSEPDLVDILYDQLKVWLIDSLCTQYKDVFESKDYGYVFSSANEKRYYRMLIESEYGGFKLFILEVHDSISGDLMLTIDTNQDGSMVTVKDKYYFSDKDYWIQKGGSSFYLNEEDFETYYLLLESLFKRARKEIENNG